MKSNIVFNELSEQKPECGTKILIITIPDILIGEYYEDDNGGDTMIPYIIIENKTVYEISTEDTVLWCNLHYFINSVINSTETGESEGWLNWLKHKFAKLVMSWH